MVERLRIAALLSEVTGLHLQFSFMNKIIDLKKQDILKQCGNAMSVNVVENLAHNLMRIN